MIQLPVDFAENMCQLLGEEEYKALADALQGESPVSIRVNPWKWHDEFLTTSAESVPWLEGAFYLDERPAFTFDPLFHAGCYYVQEASSMFVQRVLKQYVPCACKMLDLCAAPGGKSTLARAALPEGSMLVSNEIIRNRAQVLAENMIKWGHPDVVVTQNAPGDFAPFSNFFDVILADVPCSGEGMFRKDAESVEEWSMANVDICWQRQRSIVSDVWDCLKPGGLFIYSTCTYNVWEDEENIHWMIQNLGVEPLQVPIDQDWGIQGDLTGKVGSFPVYRFLPSHVKGEGFFLAVMRKPIGDASENEQAFRMGAMVESLENTSKRLKKKKESKDKEVKGTIPSFDLCRQWLVDADDFAWSTTSGDTVSAIPLKWSSDVELLKRYLMVLHAGVSVASLKGKDWVPHHSLAMSLKLQQAAFSHVEVDYETAIAYLRHEAVVLNDSVSRGYVLLLYRGMPLGFVKNIGNRANNLYPVEWRIRSGYVPESEVRL